MGAPVVRGADRTTRRGRADPATSTARSTSWASRCWPSPACSSRGTRPSSWPIQAIRRLRGRKRPCMPISPPARARSPSPWPTRSRADVYGTDLAADAVKLARRNAKRLGLTATFARGDLFGALPKRSGACGRDHPASAVRAGRRDRGAPRRDPGVRARAHPDRSQRGRDGAGPSHRRGGAEVARERRVAAGRGPTRTPPRCSGSCPRPGSVT